MSYDLRTSKKVISEFFFRNCPIFLVFSWPSTLSPSKIIMQMHELNFESRWGGTPKHFIGSWKLYSKNIFSNCTTFRGFILPSKIHKFSATLISIDLRKYTITDLNFWMRRGRVKQIKFFTIVFCSFDNFQDFTFSIFLLVLSTHFSIAQKKCKIF